MDDLGEADDYYSPLSPRIVIFDALLADLETTTACISKLPTPSLDSSGPRPTDSATICSPILYSNGHRGLNANSQQPPPPAYTPQQTVKAAQASTQPRRGDKDHLYSTVCKPKPKEILPTGTSTMVGSGLLELDRLLQELNPAQFNIADEILAQFPPGMPTETPPYTQERTPDTAPSPAAERAVGKELPVKHESVAGTANDPQPVITHTVPPPQSKSSATSATLELDKLMASLSDFKIHSTPPPQPAVQPRGSAVTGQTDCPDGNLDRMLGMLQTNLQQQGVCTVSKGSCYACQKPIVGQMVTALGQAWHPEHFVCAHCESEIGGRNFFEKEGRPYCEHNYWELFSPRCAECRKPIVDQMVTALGQNWHPEHFCCVKCGSSFGPDGFHERDGKAYCHQDFYEMFASRCHGCDKAIMENYISALNVLWHPECFICRDCYTPFVNGSFFEHGGQPYCEVHYHKQRGSLCMSCERPITGRCITAMSSRFHPEHFVCAFCLRHLNKGTFKEQNSKPYCHQCYAKLFG